MKKNYLLFKFGFSYPKINLLFRTIAVCCMISLIGCSKNDVKSGSSTSFNEGIKKVNHVVVIYMENHSFDNLYGSFAGANGFNGTNFKPQNSQVDSNGVIYKTLPGVPSNQWVGGANQFPLDLANDTFNIDQYVPADALTPDVTHRYYQEPLQIDGGKMDKYVLYNQSTELAMGYYQTSTLPLLKFAQQYTLCDDFFHSAFGGSFLNHMWLIAASSPVFPNAPASVVANPDMFKATGNTKYDGFVTPDGYAVNTCYSVNTPHPAGASADQLVPNQTIPTIGDRLSDSSISWAWYSGGWDNALAGNPDATFQFHHQPFAYFKNYADGTQAKKDHLKDETDFIAAAKNGTLPAVSFVKPLGMYNEHPNYSSVDASESHAVDLINDVLNGPNGKDVLIVLTYDENGGFWDHVVPPVIDKTWGPGTRVPALIISPFAKKSFVDHTQYETVSILSFIEKRWGLQPLADRDKNADPLSNAFDFSN
ncbi:MAG TPA: acid phosphatase [Arachidicoccus sp.]